MGRPPGKLHTRRSVASDLRRLGLKQGMAVIVHTSYKAMGSVCGGPVAVIQALMDAVTPSGTLMMPTQSADYSEPSNWDSPPVPRRWWPVMRRNLPAYDPRFTPTHRMGIVPETFRKFPGVQRSRHPSYSFAAWGRRSRWLIAAQPFADEMGKRSPLGKLYALDGGILLLGVGHSVNTSLHLAESLIPEWPQVKTGGPVLIRGRRRWLTFREVDGDSDRFAALGRAFERSRTVRVLKVGRAPSRLIPQRAMVDFAIPWLRRRMPGRTATTEV